MTPEQWGPPVWTLFHTLAQRINDDKFAQFGPQLIGFISRICRYLPCPTCSEHATAFLAKVKPNGMRTKNDLVNVLYIMHNVVNKRKNKQMYLPDVMDQYNTKNIIQVYNNFAAVYQTKGNMRLLTDTFQRQLIIKDFKRWVTSNIAIFFSNA